MTGFLFRWQMVFLKRHLLSMQGLIPLVLNVAFQVFLLVFFFTNSFSPSQDFASTLTMVVFYSIAIAVSQTATVYILAITTMKSGLLGMAPVPARAKVIFAMVETAVTALIQALILALTVGIVMVVKVQIPGGLLVFGLTFMAGFFVCGGLGIGLTALITLVLPEKQRKYTGSIVSMLYFLVIILYSMMNAHHAHAMDAFAGVFTSTAAHGFGRGGESLWFFLAAMVSAVLGLIPFLKQYGSTVMTPAPAMSTSSRFYSSPPVPSRHVDIFVWRESIARRRNRLGLIAMLIMFCIVLFLPGKFSGFGLAFALAYIGLQTGAMVLSLASTKSIALLYLLPLKPSQLWMSRVIAVLPTNAVAAVVFVMVSLFRFHVSAATAVCDLTLPFTGLMVGSFVVMLAPWTMITTTRERGGAAASVLFMLMFSVFPLAIVVLAVFKPVIGIVVDVGIVTGLYMFGRQYLDMSKSARYPLRG